MIDVLSFATKAEADAAVLALRSVGKRAEWVYSNILKLYLVNL